jgi:purine-binding chemotaxis protein CheW
VAGLANLRGQVVTAVDLREQLGLPPRGDGGVPMVVVAHVAGEPVALLVDSIGSVVDVDAEQVEPPPPTLVGPARDVVVGVYKLADRLLVCLDAEKAVAA